MNSISVTNNPNNSYDNCHRVDQTHWSLSTFYGTGRTYVFLPQESSARFRRTSRFLRTPPRRGGALTQGIPRFRVPGPVQTASAPYQLSGAQGGNLCPTALGPSAPGPPGYDRYGQFDSSFVCPQARRDPFPHLATFDSQASPLVRGMIVRARYIPGCLNVIADHLSHPNQPISTEWSLHPEIVKSIFRLWGTPEVNMFATVWNSHLPRFMSPIPEPRALAVDALSQDWQVNVHVSSIPPAHQSHSEAPVHPGSRGNYQSALVAESVVAESVVVSTPTTPLCGSPPGLSLPSRSSVPAGSEVCLGRKVVPSARMEALMRHCKAAGFPDEVSRLAAALRRPLTNRMYNDQWLRFARWAAGQGFDSLDPTAAQIASFLFTLFDTRGLSPRTVKGYRTCLGSVLNRTGKAKVVLHKTISDMIISIDLQRPRITPVFPQWDLGIVLEALSKPPYEPLREASFKHLTLKTVFLLAMASAGRRSELQALRFDQNYIQLKPKGAGVTLYFSPEFMRKNQKPNQVNGPWYIPVVPTCKSEFGPPNCPVRALRYYHRHLTEHPELAKDRRRPFVPIKDNNAGKELGASTIYRWICTTIVDSHAAIQNSRNLSGSVKAHEVRAVATSLQLSNKVHVDLHSVMKAGRWSSGGPSLPSTSEISALKLTACREQDP